MKKIRCLIFLLALFSGLYAQNLSPVLGVGDERAGIFAFTNATLVVNHQTMIENGSMVIKKGRIEAVGKNVVIPKDAVVIDLKGKYIYPSFIDLYSEYGVESGSSSGTGERGGVRMMMGRQQVFDSKIDGPFYWNDAVRPYQEAVRAFHVNATSALELKKAGFGAVVTQAADGIMRGVSSLVSLADDDEEQVVLKSKAAAGYSFDKGTSEMSYPSSPMGLIALMRQTFYDAEWYASNPDKTVFDASLEAVNENIKLPSVLQVRDKISLIEGAEIGKEFGLTFIIKGNGDEYQLIDEVKKTGSPIIVPLNFPDAPDVADQYKAILVPLEDLKHWELAPYNSARMAEKGIEFTITTDGLKDKKQFRDNLLKAVKCGLKKEDALKALTVTPAKLIGCNNILGSLEKGKIASFLITSKDFFDSDCIIYENWVQGKKYVLAESTLPELAGNYKLTLSNNEEFNISLGEEKPGSYTINVVSEDDKKESGKIAVTENLISMSIPKDNRWISLSGWINGKIISGTGYLANGDEINWKLSFTGEAENKGQEKKEEKKLTEPGKVIYPFVAYGNEILPQYKDFVIRNATVWTCENEGIFENADILVKSGKIAAVGKSLKADNVWEIDGTGMHVTPGIIDEHSHMALNGTNEGSHAITSEVRMKDVLDPEDITIYRQLAGGVTCSHLLHGSANPIGGQSVVIKLRWGTVPAEMMVKNQVGFLKHALGENVKQSRMQTSSRFPQTRMGVEQSIRDVYVRAKEYEKKWDAYDKLSGTEKLKTQPPRRDLQLDAIVDMFKLRSFMVCHTYVQSETNMIIELAKEFGIKPHTLIHNTEGYKVADQMREAGAAGSVFSDWWNYKYEVIDAISYNAALEAKQGVLVCINSDDAEMGRRLNQEAGKTVKYGGLSEIEALKLVTLNPAKILHLDDKIGSIKVGKDADLVIWTENPLSVYAKPSKTIIDGTVYYDIEKDKQMYKSIQEERSRLINKILAEGGGKGAGASGRRPPVRVNDQFIYGEDDITDYFNN